MGPETFNNVGNEAYLTLNRIPKGSGVEHLRDSNISDNGTTVTILSNTVINGTLSATGTTLVSGSSQIDHNSTTNYVANQHIDHTTVSVSAGNGLSGGGTIEATRTITLDTGSVHFLDGVKKELNTEGVISGSSQVLGGTTIHSGSFFNGITVVSGSAQVSFNGIVDKPTLVSGSSQISYPSLSNIPGGIVSGSSQVSFNGITDKPTLVSGSSQITYGSLTGIPSGIISGSSQVSFGSITGVPSGLVSGSSQITLTSLQVTTALTYTPYNATNPSGYTTNTGTVTSVGGTGTVSGLSLSGTVTSTGNLTLGGTLTVAASNFSSQTANTFLAAPNGSSGTPTFRTIVAADVPTLNQNTTGTASNITAYTINQNVGTGNLPTFAGVKGSTYFDAQASSGFRIRNSNDTANTGALTRRGLWEGNSNYDPALWAETGYGLYFYSNGSANIRAYFDTSGHLLPGANNTYNLGSASLGWANIFTNDLHLSNMNKPEGNDIDGTNGTWTIQEGVENLYIINNNNGKKFKILLEEIV
jgi:hypothetical protein